VVEDRTHDPAPRHPVQLVPRGLAYSPYFRASRTILKQCL
jgi:hypothetical protein